ncbi:MAG: hypothetical protein M5U34_32930 [Chloroflexi bacterium]|nr:hypothetical protein [Chloroflexota bacterium]
MGLVESAVANADENFGLEIDELYVSRIYADDGPRASQVALWRPVLPGVVVSGRLLSVRRILLLCWLSAKSWITTFKVVN